MSTTTESPNHPIDALSKSLAGISVPLGEDEKDKKQEPQPQVVPVKRRISMPTEHSGGRPSSSHHVPELVNTGKPPKQRGTREAEYQNARHSLQNVDDRHKLHLLAVDQTHIKADTETDSSGKSVGSMTVQSTVFDFKYENGRTYHNFRAGAYYLPNDEAEQTRLDKLHHFFLLTYGGQLHLAPLENPKRALDLGTGTGIWAIEFGDEYPGTEVIGIDLSPIQPNWLPQNVKFEIDDFEDDWLREHDSFDFIHTRNLVGCVKDWPRLFSQVFDHLAPGGYFELQETDLTGGRSDDNTFKADGKYALYQENLKLAGQKAGLRTDVAPMLAQYMLDAGFVEVREHRVKIPVGIWPKDKKLKEIGSWAHEIISEGLEAYCMAFFTRVLKMDKEEAKKICVGAKQDLDNKKIHMYYFNHFVYGRKPEAVATETISN